jgi:predicted SnoaL-like aldol condensation-catalyzing enzyme
MTNMKAKSPRRETRGASSTSAERNAAAVLRVVEEVWNRGEIELADELFTPEYVNHNGLVPDLVSGPEAIKVSVALYRAAFPGLHVTVEGLVADGKTVAFRHRRQPDRDDVQHPGQRQDRGKLDLLGPAGRAR